VLFETMFSVRFVRMGYKEDNWNPVWRRGQIPPSWPCES
jgi:hypothetical protein